MPSFREAGSNISVDLYDVIAQDGYLPNFLCHTGLSRLTGSTDRRSVEVAHMGPPLRTDALMQANVIGRAGLNEGEVRKIKDFIDRHEGEHLAASQIRNRADIAQTYCILPHATPFKNEDQRRVIRMRFSCAGFVFEAYRRAGIKIISVDHLPLATLDDVKNAYQNYAGILDHQKFRESMGLVGDGPWPIMFCGYLMHALNRSGHEIRRQPYAPTAGDELFPKP